MGAVLAGLLLVPTAATLWIAWRKFLAPIAAGGRAADDRRARRDGGEPRLRLRARPPPPHHGSLGRAAFLSARNDVLANVAIVAAGARHLVFRNAWPDLIVGVGIAIMNADAAREVFEAARKERLSPPP